MTAPPLDTPAAATAFVGTLTDDAKQCLLVALLEDAIALTGGDGLISVQTHDGKSLGYYVPPKAADARFELYGPKLTAEELEEYARRIRNPGKALSAQEWVAELKGQLAEMTARRTPVLSESA